MVLTARAALGGEVSGPFSGPKYALQPPRGHCVPHQRSGRVRLSSCMWERVAHVGPRQPCLGCRAVRGTGRVWGATFRWGRAVPFVPLLAYCPSQEGMEGWDGDWVLGGNLCWEVAGRGVCGG